MQSTEEVEDICYRSMLYEAERHEELFEQWDEDDDGGDDE